MSSIRSFSSTLLLALLPLGFLIVMVVAPLVALAFYDGSAWGGVLRDDYMQHLILWTVFQGFGNLRAGGDFGCACGVGVGAFGFSGTRFGVEAVDAAFRDADFGGGYGRVGFVRHKRCRLGGLAGYAVSVDLRQCVFQPAGFGARGVVRDFCRFP